MKYKKRLEKLEEEMIIIKKGCKCQIHPSSVCGGVCYTGKLDYCCDCEKKILQARAKLKGYKLAIKDFKKD